ncbi:hypothetical protein WJX84_003349 [Apatococcus fuscideae]|uniref:Uncharacterized protein n=1 Tax=Apatococcus fuscideae TaxID=2026836 RepID=A0AAW1TB90_9CHLO
MFWANLQALLRSAANRAGVIYEHKQSEQQKEAYRHANPDPTRNQRRPSAWPGHVAFQMHRGQSVTSCVGAYAFNRAPLLLDLTDGNVHHLLQIHDEELVVWESLTPQQAYVKQAEVLQEMSRLHPGPALRRLGNIPEEEQVPMKKCRGLRPSSGLAEQLESVVPFMPDHERVSCAREIITAKLHIP